VPIGQGILVTPPDGGRVRGDRERRHLGAPHRPSALSRSGSRSGGGSSTPDQEALQPLDEDVVSGTVQAHVRGYTVAGKTGTAAKPKKRA
jgi:hypothetical protein